jgi:putative endonuclease
VARRAGKDELGRLGERHARLVLEGHGYRFVAANWHCLSGELDLVMLGCDELVFVEVKTRRGDRAGRADDAISDAKAENVLSAGEWFVAEHPEHQHRIWRVDIVAVTLHPTTGVTTANHYVNAIVSG